MSVVTLLEWQDHFRTEDACQKYLFQQRWPKGFVCPQCQCTSYWTGQRSDRTTPLYECAGCGHQASLTAETLFHRTKVALQVCFFSHFSGCRRQRGSALVLSRELGLRYGTAPLLHHNIQQAIKARNAHYQLGSLVELGDTYFGEVSHGEGKRGQGTNQDPMIVDVSFNSPGHPRHIFMDAVLNLKKDTVLEVLPQSANRIPRCVA